MYIDRLREALEKTERAVNSKLGAIVIVDDEDIERRVMARAIGDKGYNLIMCDSGLKLIQVLSSTQVSLVITDMQMPQMNGLEVAHVLRTHNIPCILVSGLDSMNESVLETRALGVPFIPKIDIDDQLKDLVERTLT